MTDLKKLAEMKADKKYGRAIVATMRGNIKSPLIERLLKEAYLAGFRDCESIAVLQGKIEILKRVSEVRISPEKAHFWHYKDELKKAESALHALLQKEGE